MNWKWIRKRFYEMRIADQTYGRYLMGFLQFVVTIYTLGILRYPFWQSVFSSLIMFTSSFLGVYIPMMVLLGHFYHLKKQYETESELTAKASPWNRDVSRALRLMAEGKHDEVIELMRKWEIT